MYRIKLQVHQLPTFVPGCCAWFSRQGRRKIQPKSLCHCFTAGPYLEESHYPIFLSCRFHEFLLFLRKITSENGFQFRQLSFFLHVNPQSAPPGNSNDRHVFTVGKIEVHIASLHWIDNIRLAQFSLMKEQIPGRHFQISCKNRTHGSSGDDVPPPVPGESKQIAPFQFFDAQQFLQVIHCFDCQRKRDLPDIHHSCSQLRAVSGRLSHRDCHLLQGY